MCPQIKTEKKVILLIDDEQYVMKFYVRALQLLDFEIKQFDEVDAAIKFLVDERRILSVIVLDVMMSAGAELQEYDTNQGLDTGVYLYKFIRDLYPDVPIVILTSNPDILSRFPYDTRLTLANKLDTTPSMFAKLISKVVENKSGSR